MEPGVLVLGIVQSAMRMAIKDKRLKGIVITAGIFVAIGVAMLLVSDRTSSDKGKLFAAPGGVFLTIGVVTIVGVGLYGQEQERHATEAKIQAVEQRVESHPNESRPAWDLARIKLEAYLNRNLNQVRWIFFLALIAMFAGFGLVLWGVIKSYQTEHPLAPSILAASAGVMTELISAGFLMIYRSTMAHAKSNVAVLERINAVGMAVQILDSMHPREDGANESISEGVALNKARVALASQLLAMYSLGPSRRGRNANAIARR